MQKTQFKEFPQFAFLNDSQFNELTSNDAKLKQKCFDFHCDIETQMIEQIHEALNNQISFDDELFYDIEVSLDSMTFKVNAIHEASNGTHAIQLFEPLNLTELPIVLPMPTLFNQIIEDKI